GCGFEIAAVELVLVGEGDRMHDEIDLAPPLLQHIEHRIDGRGIRDVAMAEQEAVQFLRQRFDALLQCVTLPGQRDLGARRMASLRDAPGDRTIIGNAEHNAALALHQTRMLHPPFPPSLEKFAYTSPRPGYSPQFGTPFGLFTSKRNWRNRLAILVLC